MELTGRRISAFSRRPGLVLSTRRLRPGCLRFPVSQTWERRSFNDPALEHEHQNDGETAPMSGASQ